MKKKHWYDWLWLWSLLFFCLGFFNILFAWLGMIDFLLPLIIALVKGDKFYCNSLCGRGQLFHLLGGKLRLTRHPCAPRWLFSKYFRFAFLSFFMLMFAAILLQTYNVFAGVSGLQPVVTLLWSIAVPWEWAYTAGTAEVWMAQFAYGFYSLMLTSFIIGLALMIAYKPRTWCGFCPMGTLTQAICRLRAAKLQEGRK